jgi:hypothetical protein
VTHTTAKTKIASMNLRVDEIEVAVELVVEVVHVLASAPIVEVEVEGNIVVEEVEVIIVEVVTFKKIFWLFAKNYII